MMYNITHDDYTFVEKGDMWAIKLKGKFDGVIYHYGHVQATIDDDEVHATLSFKYQIIDPADFNQTELESSEDFNNYIGAVLQHTITDAFETGKYSVGDNATNNSNNSTKESTH
jgi:hypothetical protein